MSTAVSYQLPSALRSAARVGVEAAVFVEAAPAIRGANPCRACVASKPSAESVNCRKFMGAILRGPAFCGQPVRAMPVDKWSYPQYSAVARD